MKYLIFSIITSLIVLQSYSPVTAQCIITGSVIDSLAGNGLPGVNIRIAESHMGTVTDNNGAFALATDCGKNILVISSVGYIERNIEAAPIEGKQTDLGRILLSPAIIGLAEVRVIASEAEERKTPVTVSTISADVIEKRLGDQPFPDVMKSVPGVYATRTGGGSGDASVNIRGFQQENVDLLLNGVPIGSVENGLVYWNNWIGLTDATREIQVQRGISASKVALNSVGGSINIITKTTDIEKGGSIKYSLTDYGNSKFNLMLSTGRMKNNMAITFMGSRFSGPGYADATYVDGWAYFLSVSKEFNKNHILVFTVMGNPERHGQRNFKLSQAEVDERGLKYNQDWGSYNGEINNASENFYHKPYLTLNHYWKISEKSMLATSYYLSAGKGGGKWTESFGGNPWIFSYYNPSGQIDWERIYGINSTNADTFQLATGEDTTGYSLNIQTNFLAEHVWTGLLSTFQHDINDRFKVIAGIHGRYFKSRLYEKVRDLLGGNFFIDDYAYAVDGVAGRNQVKHVGDLIKLDNGAIVDFASLFGQVEYNDGAFSAFVAGTVSGNWYRREDRYNYVVQDIKSEWVFKEGADIKAGMNYNINEYHNIYVNAGYFSKAPYYKFIFANYTNQPTQDLENEKVMTAEAGYGLNMKKTRLRLNGYYTKWKDKSILTNEYNQFEDPSMVRGLDALHVGFEGEIRQQAGDWLTLGASFSYGDWKWKNDVTALVYNDDNVVVDTINVYADGLYVGDAPQTQVSLFGTVKILKSFELTAEWFYNDRFYANFNPSDRTNPGDRDQSYRIPAYNELDLHAGLPFRIGSLRAYGNISCYNVLNSKYIIRGEDGDTHNLEDFRGFWGFGRNFAFSLKVDF